MIKYNINKNKDLLIVFTGFFILFLIIMYWVGWQSDLPAHVQIAKEKLENKDYFSGNFLMYTLLNLFSGFSGHRNVMKIVLCLMLSLATALKYGIVRDIFRQLTIYKYAKWVAVSLIFVYIIPMLYFFKPFSLFLYSGNLYLEYYVPNVWHNSTIIFLFPFALCLYFLSLKQLRNFNKITNIQMIILVAINIFIKPSFFFVFVCAYPVMLLLKYGIKIRFWKGMFPIFFGILCLMIEYISIYNQASDGSSVVLLFDPVISMQFWKSKILYLLISLAFPFFYFVTHFNKCISDDEFLYVLLLIIAALGIFFVCYETGPRATHGNFYWQIVISMWLSFYYVVKNNLKDYMENGMTLLNKITNVLYSIHVIFGLIYLANILITKTYY